MQALDGVRVVDLTEALAGPYCTMILGDLGADVVKIERPGDGDQSRKWGPPFIGTESAYFLSVNRNKRSAVFDIKSAEGREHVRSLVERADVFICNVRKLESLREAGLSPDTMCASNPRLIYCSITAYGRTGPYSGRGGYDLVAQGESGLMQATGEPGGEPMRWPVAIADLSCGMWAAAGILAALFLRERTGKGQFIDQSLLDSQLSWAAVMAGQYLATEELPARLGNRHANIVPYQVFRARDKHMVIAVGTQGHWRKFCEALRLGPDVCESPRFATNADRLRNRDELVALLSAAFRGEDADHWLTLLRKADIPSGPVNALDEALNDPQVSHRGMVVELEHPMGALRVLGSPLRLSASPVTYRRRPPLLGEHTEEVLAELGSYANGLVSSPDSGVPVGFHPRPPRYVSEFPLRMESSGTVGGVTTINVSDHGCAIRYRGNPPRVGEMVTLRLDDRVFQAPAVVRWISASSASERTLGLELIGTGQMVDVWESLVAQAARTGSHAA